MISDKYKVKRGEDEEIRPEETLADSLSQHTVVEVPIGWEVFRIFYFLIAVGLIFLLGKSLQLQLVKGRHFAVSAQRLNSSSYTPPALRGIIYDANDQALVDNIPIFDLIALTADLSRRSPGTDNSQDGITAVINSIASITGQSAAELEKIFSANLTKAVFLIKSDLSKEEAVKIKTRSLPGIYVVANVQRHYLKSPAFSSVIGYTAKVSPEDIAQDDYYLLTDRVGRLGLEQYYEKYLRGEHHNAVIKESESSQENTSQPGHDLYLNIDEAMQSQLYWIMANVLSSTGLKRGAAVVQDPRTGAVKALLSLPSFDNNLFENSADLSNSDSKWVAPPSVGPETEPKVLGLRSGPTHLKPSTTNSEKILKILQDKNQPLFNRIISGRYSPGSTIKPLLALAGLKENVVTPQTTVYANGSITVKSKYDPNIVYTFRDWKIHGLTDLKKAIADSVDVYFYALGGGYGNIRGLGDQKIVSYLKDLMVDAVLGIDLPGEASGFVPTEEWKLRTKGEEWFIGDTYNISIGQGDLVVTPLWLNSYVSAIANGGNLMRPYIVKEIKTASGQSVSQVQPEVLAKMPFDKASLAIVKIGMRQAVLTGTAGLLQDLPQPVAAKTGTAQIAGRGLNSLFITFGPYDEPTIAMTVLVENIQSQGLAIRIAHDFLAWYFSR